MKSIIIVVIWGMSALCAVCIIGWHFGLSYFLELPPSTWPLPYTSALCLFLCGLAFFTLFSSYRFPLSNILGLIIFLFGLQKTMQLLLPTDLKWYPLLNSIRFYPENTSEVHLTASIGFMLTGILFMFWSEAKQNIANNIGLLFMSTLIIFLGAFGIFTHLLPIVINDTLQKILVHFYTAIGLFFIGFGFIVARFTQKPVKPSLEQGTKEA